MIQWDHHPVTLEAHEYDDETNTKLLSDIGICHPIWLFCSYQT